MRCFSCVWNLDKILWTTYIVWTICGCQDCPDTSCHLASICAALTVLSATLGNSVLSWFLEGCRYPSRMTNQNKQTNNTPPPMLLPPPSKRKEKEKRKKKYVWSVWTSSWASGWKKKKVILQVWVGIGFLVHMKTIFFFFFFCRLCRIWYFAPS